MNKWQHFNLGGAGVNPALVNVSLFNTKCCFHCDCILGDSNIVFRCCYFCRDAVVLLATVLEYLLLCDVASVKKTMSSLLAAMMDACKKDTPPNLQ